jgi:hypothetical protein
MTSELLASKMLSGWTMLAEACPHCEVRRDRFTLMVQDVPLLRNRNRLNNCVRCGRYYTIDEEGVIEENFHPERSVSAAGQGPSELASRSPVEQASQSSAHDAVSPPAKRPSGQSSVSSMSERLLKGWAMLATNCPKGCSVTVSPRS